MPLFRKAALIAVSLVIFSAGAVSAKKITVFTAGDIVRIIKDKITQMRTFSGSFTYSFNSKTYAGLIQYKSPDKFLMSFYGKSSSGGSVDTGQKFVSDGKNLWLVFKDQNIAINETLERDKKNPLLGWNIDRLLKEYVPTLPKTNYLVSYKNEECYKIIFVPKSNTAGFKYINMIAGMEGEILKVEAQNQLGNTVELGITYNASSINAPVSDDYFDYKPDENTQQYENILLPNSEEPQQNND
jgi:outer membrane lipoprotein-sorting protein